MSRHLLKLIFITTLLAVVTSCGSSRKNAPAIGDYTPGKEHQSDSPGLTWADMRVPVTIDISQPSSFRVSGVMTMVNGKDIHISLRMLGFEVGAAYITSDSVFAYAKLQRVYVAESISRILGGLDAGISDVQSLLIGAPLSLPSLRGGTNVDMRTSDTTGQPLDITITHPSGRKGSITYTPLPGTPLASEVAISAASGQKKLAASLSYNWNRAQADTGATKPFSIPRGYRRIDASALLKSLKL